MSDFQTNCFDFQNFQKTLCYETTLFHCLIFVVLADLTERSIQNCLKLGITADFSSNTVTAKIGLDGCHHVNPKQEGQFSLFSV